MKVASVSTLPTPVLPATGKRATYQQPQFSQSAFGQPKFGMINLSQVVQMLNGNPQLKNGSQNGNGLGKFFLKNVVAPMALTLALMNIQWGVSQARQLENRVFNNIELSSVAPLNVPGQEPTMEREDLLALIENPGIKLTQQHVLEMAKAGLIKQILVPDVDANKVIVVLKNGQEVSAEADNTTRATLITEFNVNVDRPFLHQFNFDLLMAGALSSILVFGFQALMAGAKKTVKTIRKDPDIQRRKRRMSALETGYSVMALKLGVSLKPVRFEKLETQTESLRDKLQQGREYSRSNPEINEVINWMTVMLAGQYMEHCLFSDETNKDHTSVDANSFRTDASDFARTLIKQYGLANPSDSGYLPGTPADLEARAKTLFDEMEASVEETFGNAPRENMEELRQAMETLGSFSRRRIFRKPQLSLEEIDAILHQGKTLDAILDARAKAN